MFLASKPRLVHLFESVYREEKLLQESTFEIARLYYEAGLKVEECFQLPPDHICVELEFVAYLRFNEAKALCVADEEKRQYATSLQDTVMKNHLGRFAAQLGEKMEAHAKTGFYRQIGRILRTLHPTSPSPSSAAP